jgi:2-dehydro-3-deoxygalactonokinase
MASYITVDSGTTNTRVSLVIDGIKLDTLKFGVEPKENESRKDCLTRLLRTAISNILEKNKMQETQISRIIASGMITSEIGLIELEHVKAPCGVKELSENLYEITIEEISKIPFVFIRGVKYISDDNVDMMRGEETEIYGINPKANTLYVLPGSHSKLVLMDNENRISHFSTCLTGEMIGAIANNTILKGCIDLSKSATDQEFLQKGYLFAKENGINSALFKVRSLKKFSRTDDNQTLSFFMGVMLACEIDNIVKSLAQRVVIGGKNQLKDPTAFLLKQNSDKEILTVSEEEASNATVIGAIMIYENSLL